MRPVTSLIFGALLLAAPGFSHSPKGAAPVYDRASVVDVAGIVTDVRNSPSGWLPGLHLIIATEKKGDIDVYVGPEAFVRDFGFKFTRGEEVRATGSKSKSDTGDVLLAREIRRRDVTVYLRDRDGNPLW
jgi:hypothetical protein